MDHHAHMEDMTETSPRKDPPAGHGMLVVGLGTRFFYHLPMFMSPHDYQVVLEGTLSQPGSDPQGAYREDRKAHGQTRVYTFAPASFVLPDVFPPAPKLKKIHGRLFRGHFESPAEYPANPFQIGGDVAVNISNVVFQQKLLPLPPALDRLEYLLFGKAPELFVAHLITKRGDFDHVLSANVKGHEFPDEELRRGVRIQFGGKANRSSERLVEGKAAPGTAKVLDKKVVVELKPLVEFYMSERDLA
ncbi:MAG: hypothetical protein ABJA98_06470 [Acidobacteriota bacterium]